MRHINVGIILGILVITATCAFGMGITVQDLVVDYNKTFGADWFTCQKTANDFYRAIDQNFQKANLQLIAIKTGTLDPITNLDGHRIVTYTEGRDRYVISTYPMDKYERTFEVAVKNYGDKTLHEICESFVPGYRYVMVYRKGFGFITIS